MYMRWTEEGEKSQEKKDSKSEAPKTRDIVRIIGKKKDGCENFNSNTTRGFL